MAAPTLDDAAIRALASSTYNEAYDAMEAGDLPKAMELSATSLSLWRKVSTVTQKNLSIGCWLLSRILSLAGAGDLALAVAEEGRTHSEKVEFPEDWFKASMMEGWARALLAVNDARAKDALVAAKSAIEAIVDARNKELIGGQFADIAIRSE